MANSRNDEDVPPDAGKKPPYVRPEPPLGEVGTGDGYSGEAYDSAGQAEWRRKQREKVVKDGRVTGSGKGAGGGAQGEDYDTDLQGGSG